jgi:hypothetical protein
MHDDNLLIDFVKEVICQHSPDIDTSSFELRSSWKSRTATLYRYGLEDSVASDVVVKILKNPSEAGPLYQSMRETHDLLWEVHPHKVPDFRPIGYSPDLGAVTMPFIGGKTLGAILQNGSEHASWHDSISNYVFRCGQILGVYHAKFQDRQGTFTEEAISDFADRMAPVLGEKVRFACTLVGDAIISRSYGDFHPGHMIITDIGKQVVPLDPPLFPRYVFIYRDISRFFDQLFMLHLHPLTRRHGIHRVWKHEELSEKFLEGYMDAFPFLRDNPHTLDRALLSGFEASLLKRRMRRLWNPKRVHQLAYFGGPLLYRYYYLKYHLMMCLQPEH